VLVLSGHRDLTLLQRNSLSQPASAGSYGHLGVLRLVCRLLNPTTLRRNRCHLLGGSPRSSKAPIPEEENMRAQEPSVHGFAQFAGAIGNLSTGSGSHFTLSGPVMAGLLIPP